LVRLPPPAGPGPESLPLQTRRLAAAAGADPVALAAQMAVLDEILALLATDVDAETLRPQLRAHAQRQLELGGEAARAALGDQADAVIEQQIAQVTTPWFRAFLRHDPRPVLRRLEIPVLVLQGELDLQVDADQNLPEIRRALAQNPDVTVHRLSGLNHLLQHAETGTVEEYGRIEETIAPEVLALIGDWIAERFLDPPQE
jgi:pimeloyl-ACP methyl ester carboxylesterase